MVNWEAFSLRIKVISSENTTKHAPHNQLHAQMLFIINCYVNKNYSPVFTQF